MVMLQWLPNYPPLDGLFDSASVKAYAGRRSVYNVAPDWRPTVVGIPFSHQYWMLACFLQYRQFLALADTGLGKTKVGLDALEYAFQHWGIKHALILTGLPISTDEWVEQATNYIKVPCRDISGSPAERRAQIAHYPTTPITVSDYATLQTAFCVKKLRSPNSKHGKMVADIAALAQFGRQFDAVILDEIHRLKDPASLRFRMVEPLVAEIGIRWGLTGTLFDRHPEDAWAQFHLVDNDLTLGSRHDFLRYFFDEKKSFWSKYSVEYKLRADRKDEFRRRIRARSIRIAKAECKDIPDMQVFPVNLKASAEQRKLIKDMERQIRQARDRDEQVQSFSYLRQLVSGLQRVKSDEVDATLRLAVSPKITWTLDLLDRLDEKEQVVIFYEFRASGEWLNEVLAGAKIKTSWLFGGVLDEAGVLATWKAKKTRVLLTQTQKAAESLNLQQAAYLVQYESPLTYRLEKQSLARVGGRIGGRPSIGYKLAIRGCVEQRIMAMVREGKAISTDLLEVVEDL